MSKVCVWTKQDKRIVQVLEQEKRYIVKKEYIKQKMDSISPLYLDVYTWYAKAASRVVAKPDDVKFPVWVTRSEALDNDEDTVILSLLVDEEMLVNVDYVKWGYVVNYQYIPESPEDEQNHNALMARYGVDDAEAYLSPHYPMLKKKILKSWDSMFLENNAVKEEVCTLWEVRAEWVQAIR